MKTVNQCLAERKQYPLKVHMAYVVSALSHIGLAVIALLFSMFHRGGPDVVSFSYYTADLVSMPRFHVSQGKSAASAVTVKTEKETVEDKSLNVISPEPEKEKKKPDVKASEDSKKVKDDFSQMDKAGSKGVEAATDRGFSFAGGGNLPGDAASLGSMDMRFAWYRASIVDILNHNWIQVSDSFSRQNRTVIVRFNISRDGTISDLEIEKTSGSLLLDRGVRRAILASNPLPPIPSGIEKKQLTARFKFVY